jgi:ATP-binding cassette subfamily B protein
MGPMRGTIRFEGVHFRHDREAVLDGVDLVIPAGAHCAVLGESGAGKSTLADLLVRLQDPQSGRITIDGTDIRDVALGDLRREVLLVDQAPFLFNATIAANIAFALESATTAQVQAAAEAAGLGPLLQRLPQGLQTPVGERGLSLSAGERQRIAIARALLRRPSVLVLDEPTAALDAATERRVAEGLRAALPDATLIIITHRPALTEGADMVVTLTDGKASLT